ncbi:hypothetical protein C7441_11013 [Pseudaminobacter salicylatoxidans]|uniref:DUF3168 domain-containing protein n=1 Tax=Pseudaminobacter salicylatoxidans TaxID=93369 RepID=A0A316C0G2_PSESE|nr:hypothetical protein [Pseudaminobacter salicylatoxidans]PWJ81482.1 hypothetical protein C7441_11013 [Pseudaminobacter salicylatoxidans]
MTAPTLEVLAPLRAAIIANAAITAKLGKYLGAPSVHTRRPVPVDAGYPMVTVGPIIARTDEDGINTFRPVVVIDINTYGEAAEHYRNVEAVADVIYAMFHRQRTAITVAGYSVTQITASGPSPAPADDDQHVGRRVTLTIRLFAN